MEAFKTIFLTTDTNGNKRTVSNTTFACTGWEATEKSRKYLLSIGYGKLIFLKWKVLNPFYAWFK